MTENKFRGEVGLGLARTAGLALPRASIAAELFEPTCQDPFSGERRQKHYCGFLELMLLSTAVEIARDAQ